MPKGETIKPPKRITRRQTLLDGFSDWILLLDLEDHKLVFPPEVYSTPLRPDIVIWSAQRQHVLMVELTCPAEEGIEAAQVRRGPLSASAELDQRTQPKLVYRSVDY